jgi:hypothetical protein
VTDDDAPEFDLARIVEVFNRHEVSYIAIGGISGMLHGAIYYITQDVDLMVRSNQDNLHRIAAALVELGVEVDGELTAERLVGNTQWQTAAGPVDILLSAAGPGETEITFRELDLSSQLFEVAKGLLLPTAALDDVIRMKEAADRVKDHRALPELRRLRGDRHPERSRDVDPFADFEIDEDLD